MCWIYLLQHEGVKKWYVAAPSRWNLSCTTSFVCSSLFSCSTNCAWGSKWNIQVYTGAIAALVFFKILTACCSSDCLFLIIVAFLFVCLCVCVCICVHAATGRVMHAAGNMTADWLLTLTTDSRNNGDVPESLIVGISVNLEHNRTFNIETVQIFMNYSRHVLNSCHSFLDLQCFLIN